MLYHDIQVDVASAFARTAYAAFDADGSGQSIMVVLALTGDDAIEELVGWTRTLDHANMANMVEFVYKLAQALQVLEIFARRPELRPPNRRGDPSSDILRPSDIVADVSVAPQAGATLLHSSYSNGRARALEVLRKCEAALAVGTLAAAEALLAKLAATPVETASSYRSIRPLQAKPPAAVTLRRPKGSLVGVKQTSITAASDSFAEKGRQCDLFEADEEDAESRAETDGYYQAAVKARGGIDGDVNVMANPSLEFGGEAEMDAADSPSDNTSFLASAEAARASIDPLARIDVPGGAGAGAGTSSSTVVVHKARLVKNAFGTQAFAPRSSRDRSKRFEEAGVRRQVLSSEAAATAAVDDTTAFMLDEYVAFAALYRMPEGANSQI